MATLPTITVTQEQADKILLAFGADQSVAIVAYQNWLTEQVRAYVLADAGHKLKVASDTANALALASIDSTLPVPVQPVP